MNVHWPWLEGLFSLGGDAAQSSHSPHDDITSTLDGFLYRARLNPLLDMLYLSNNALEITGYEPDVLTRSPTVSYDTLIHPDDTEEVHDVLEQALRERSSFTVDYRLVDRRTNERWVEQQGEAVFDETDGRVLQGYIHDITEPQQLHLEDRIIRKAAEFVTQPGGFEETLESILQVICSMCNWEFGEIWFPQFVDSKTLTAQVHYNPDNGELEAFWEGNRTVKLERGEGLVGRVWETGETEWTESTGTDRTFLGSERARRAGLRTALGIPCKADEETVAVLVFYRNRKDKKSLMVDLLETVGKQIGSLLRKKQLEHKLNEQREFYQNLFLDSPAAILVSDLSAVKSRLDELSAGGVEDLEGHLLNHRDTLEELVGSIRPLDVNQSAKDMLNVTSADDGFPKSPVPFCNGDTYEALPPNSPRSTLVTIYTRTRDPT